MIEDESRISSLGYPLEHHHINVLIVGENQIFLELLGQYLSSFKEISTTGRSHPSEIKQNLLIKPDIVLFVEGCNSQGIKREFLNVKKSFPDSKIIFLSTRGDIEEMELTIIKKGARGFLCTKDSLKTLVKAIKSCYVGEIWASRKSTTKVIDDLKNKKMIKEEKVEGLTRQEKRVLILLTSGFKNAEIAEKLFISEKTVKTHINRIFKKIKVSNRLQAALWASKNLINSN